MKKKTTLDGMTDDEIWYFGCKQYNGAIDILCESLKDFAYPDRRNYSEILLDLDIVSKHLHNIALAVYQLRRRDNA